MVCSPRVSHGTTGISTRLAARSRIVKTVFPDGLLERGTAFLEGKGISGCLVCLAR